MDSTTTAPISAASNAHVAAAGSNGQDTQPRNDGRRSQRAEGECARCHKITSSSWTNSPIGKLCNSCGPYFSKHGRQRPMELIQRREWLAARNTKKADKICARCEDTENISSKGKERNWRIGPKGAILCADCGRYFKDNGVHRPRHLWKSTSRATHKVNRMFAKKATKPGQTRKYPRERLSATRVPAVSR